MPFAPCQKDCETDNQGHCHPHRWDCQEKTCYDGDGPAKSFHVSFTCRVDHVPIKQQFKISADDADAAFQEALELAAQKLHFSFVICGGLGGSWFLGVDLFGGESDCHYAIKVNTPKQAEYIMANQGIPKSICFAVKITPEA